MKQLTGSGFHLDCRIDPVYAEECVAGCFPKPPYTVRGFTTEEVGRVLDQAWRTLGLDPDNEDHRNMVLNMSMADLVALLHQPSRAA
jgi:hypothetical protein